MDPASAVAQLTAAFQARGRVIVAFSGGVDSAVLAKIGADALGPAHSLALIVDSESYPREEREAALAFARELNVPHDIVFHSELADARYAANPIDRCYFCRQGLGDVAKRVAAELGFAHVAVGTNADDMGDWRPGLKAIREHGLWEPFLELSMTKADVRALARHMGLPVADKPSMACLSSRIPYGEAITIEKLTRVGRAESFLRAAAFRQVRVRTMDATRARIEVASDELPRLREMRTEVETALRAMGYASVEIDERGYRTGSMHEGLRLATAIKRD